MGSKYPALAFAFLSIVMLGSTAVGAQVASGEAISPAFAVPAPDKLAAEFLAPPSGARPRVWWHWLSGNIGKQGITLDMEWMKRVGIGGLQMFDGEMGAPKIVEHRVAALSPEWLDSLRFAATEADRLGLEFGMAAAPGWSETGGPWVAPQAAMKKLVWSEVRVTGGKRIQELLPMPPSVAGRFMDIGLPETAVSIAPFYRDIAVLAYRLPATEKDMRQLRPAISTNAGDFDLATLIDGKLARTVTLADPAPTKPIWVQYAFDRPQAVGAFTYAGPLPGRFVQGPTGRILSSNDGVDWTLVAVLPGAAQTPAPQRTIAFPLVTARFFRIRFDSLPSSGRGPGKLTVSELAPVPGVRVNAFEDKAGFGILAEGDTLATPDYAEEVVVRPEAVVDLTAKLRQDGKLDWTPPKGRWSILRLGYSLTGATNHPATPEATGLEVDKLHAGHVRAHLDAYMAPVVARLGEYVGNRGLAYMLTDSWEAGVQNWTDEMAAEFRKRRGYDPLPWLPVLAGRVIESGKASDRFLWDFRRTIADLVAENHYGTITDFAREHDLGYYGEAVGASWPTVADGMQAKRFTDIPMGEYWAIPFGEEPAAFQGVRSDEFPADIVETASTAHIYGKPLVAAEALTSSLPLFSATPWSLKWVADKYMAMGINLHVLHTSPHQPGTGNVPGLTLGPFSQTFTRNETWAEMAEPWITYLSRSSYLLQQGRAAADILYFYGEGAPSGVPYREAHNPEVPEGYSADYINAEALLALTSVADNHVVTPSGGRYRLLVLPNTLSTMTLPVANKLRELVRAGATLVGPKPLASPSLATRDDALKAVVDELWGAADGRLAARSAFGAGTVYWGRPLEQILKEATLLPDFDYTRPRIDTRLVFAHRTSANADIYFVSNQSGERQQVDARFRVAGREAQIWRADDGSMVPATFASAGGVTTVPLDLQPYDAQFVVFNRPTSATSRSIAAPTSRQLAAIDGGWGLSFPPDWGAPARLQLPRLASWTTHPDAGVRYFSGTATYRKTINVPAGWLRHQRVELDLGEVRELARVRVNGRESGIAWKPPYRLDVMPLLRPGPNIIEIDVANLWRNRLIGDAQPGVAKKYTMTSAPLRTGEFGGLGDPPGADSPLLESGLLGPVTLNGVDGVAR